MSESLQAENNISDKWTEIKNHSRKRHLIIIAILLFVIILTAGLIYWIHASIYESTDDAFIDGIIAQISPKISGNVIKLYITDNQRVKKGDLLVAIDPRDYQARLEQAKGAFFAAIARQKGAKINVKLVNITSGAEVKQASAGVNFSEAGAKAARQQIEVTRSNLQQTNAQIIASRADTILALQNLKRFQELFAEGAVSRQQLDTAIDTYQSANAQLKSAIIRRNGENNLIRQAQAQLAQAQASTSQAAGKLQQVNTVPENIAISKSQLEASNAEIKQLRGALKQAQLELSYTKIYAPINGYITKRSVEKGSYVQTGQALFAIVPDKVWVTANYKETQLAKMKPGQKAFIKVDTYSHKKFKGHVDSIQRGTGARFSLLPPENAVGSYVKVVQRVPVKIMFDEKPGSQYLLVPGMSVVPEVNISAR